MPRTSAVIFRPSGELGAAGPDQADVELVASASADLGPPEPCTERSKLRPLTWSIARRAGADDQAALSRAFRR